MVPAALETETSPTPMREIGWVTTVEGVMGFHPNTWRVLMLSLPYLTNWKRVGD